MAARRREAKRRAWPAHLNQNGAGYFYWRDPDTKKSHGLGRDQAKAFAEARAANLAVEQRRGTRSLAQKILEPAGKTLDDWTGEYEKIYVEDRKPTKSTLMTVRAGIKAARTAPFLRKHLKSIKTDEVADFISKQAEARSPQMAALIRKTLMDMFREAEVKGLIETGKNPVTVTRVPNFEVERSRLTIEQFQAIHAAALELDPWIARSLELGLLTAQRREDVANMLFADVKDGFLFVTQEKTKVKLRIPVAIRLEVLGLSLDDVVKRCRDRAVSKWMLHHSRRLTVRQPGDPVGKDALTKAFQKAREAAKITWEEGRTPPSFHELRSLSARLYTEQFGKEFAQALLGHKSASMTEMYRDTRGAEWTEIKLTG
ncbi:MAG: tyrosine-type recombinase/integrase [Paraburkholderia fungorum]|nr:tyrosine-type recombinase/integrase [Paraburkholderia fungorum]